MNKMMNVFTNKGFRNLNNLTHTQVYYFLNKELTLEPPDLKRVKCYQVILSTGMVYYLSEDSTIKGLTFSKNIIDNTLDLMSIKNYNLDDYIYTPFLDISEYSNKLSYIVLNTSCSSKDLEYIGEDIEALLKEENDLESLIDTKFSNQDSQYLKTIPNNIKVDDKLIDFLVVSILRGRTTTKLLTLDQNTISIKQIAYRFKKDNLLHLEMYEKLDKFLTHFGVPQNKVDYDKYFYINIYCSPLIEYLNKFILDNYKDILSCELNIQKLFLEELFKYSKNNFHTNPSTFFSLKNLCYNTKKVLSFSYRSNISEATHPICASIISYNSCESELNPEVVILDDGYLTRIVDIKEELEPLNIIKNYLLIG